MDINFEYYKIFYHTAMEGSLSLAARKLCISQPAVSQAVKQLEKGIGCSLFIRGARGIRLTKEGEILFSYVKKGCEQLIMGEEKIRQMLELDSGEIHIGASDMTLRFFLLPYLESFHEQYPNIKISVTNAPTPETLSYLAEGSIDFGIVSEPVEAPEGIQFTPVHPIEDVFVAGSRFQNLREKKLQYGDLQSQPIILLEGNTSTRRYVNDFLNSHDVALSPEFELATSDMIVQFALRNLGIGCVVRDFAREYLERGELFELQFEGTIPQRKLCLAVNTRVPLSTSARMLLDMAKP